jgi:rod shape-determining protein MreC
MMTVDHRLNHLQTVRSVLSVVVYPIQQVVNSPMSLAGWMSDRFSSREKLLARNSELRERQVLLEAKLLKLSALEAENARLRELMDSSLKVGDRILIGELLYVDPDPYRQQVVIDKGTEHGVYSGQAVLDAKGIMGQTGHVGPLTSSVILITDPSHAIPVQVNRNGLRTIAIGTGTNNRLELSHLPNNADIRTGDLLISSGLGGRFPPDYPVAVVTTARTDPGRPFAVVYADPNADLERSRELLLVWPETPEFAPSLASEAEIDNLEDNPDPEVPAQ